MEARCGDGLQLAHRRAGDAPQQQARNFFAGEDHVLVERIDCRRDVVEQVRGILGDNVDIGTDDEAGITQPRHEGDTAGLVGADEAIRRVRLRRHVSRRHAERDGIAVEVHAFHDDGLDARPACRSVEPGEHMMGAGKVVLGRD